VGAHRSCTPYISLVGQHHRPGDMRVNSFVDAVQSVRSTLQKHAYRKETVISITLLINRPSRGDFRIGSRECDTRPDGETERNVNWGAMSNGLANARGMRRPNRTVLGENENRKCKQPFPPPACAPPVPPAVLPLAPHSREPLPSRTSAQRLRPADMPGTGRETAGATPRAGGTGRTHEAIILNALAHADAVQRDDCPETGAHAGGRVGQDAANARDRAHERQREALGVRAGHRTASPPHR
jgi:hypothetical protein